MIDITKLKLKTNRFVNSLFVGSYKTAFKGRGLQFSDYKIYDENDDSKYIDFLASAREGKLLMKRFEEERELIVFFLLDLSESMNFGEEKTKIDTLIETFYILAFSAQKNNDKIGAIIFNDNGFKFIKPGKGTKNIHKILKIINENKIKSISDFDIDKLLTIFNNLPIKNGLVFLLTDKIDEISEKILKIFSIKNDIIYINIFDYFENNLNDGDYIIKIGNTFKTIFLNLRNKKKILEYREFRRIKIKNFAKKLNKYKISYFFIDNKSNIFRELLKFFKSR